MEYRRVNKDGVVLLEHRAIMEELLGRPLRSNEVVHHIDGDKHNNEPSNLMVVSREEHARIHSEDIKRDKAVVQFDTKGNVVKEWPSAREASRETDASYQNIYKCCRDKRKTAGGFGWKYAAE